MFDSDATESRSSFPTQRDVRRSESTDEDRPKQHELAAAEIAQRIEAVHQRLLEAATGGRLTWSGDQIVEVIPRRRRSVDRTAVARRERASAPPLIPTPADAAAGAAVASSP